MLSLAQASSAFLSISKGAASLARANVKPAFVPMTCMRNTEGDEDGTASKISEEEVEKVGNLILDDEWMGLSMELSELVRVAVLEDVKSKTTDFIGKDDYKVRFVSRFLPSSK